MEKLEMGEFEGSFIQECVLYKGRCGSYTPALTLKKKNKNQGVPSWMQRIKRKQ